MKIRNGLLRPAILDPHSEKKRTSFLLTIPDGRMLEVLTQTGTLFTAEDMLFFANHQVEVQGEESGNVFRMLGIKRLDD